MRGVGPFHTINFQNKKKQRKKLLSYMKNLEICLILTLKLSDALRMMKDMILYLEQNMEKLTMRSVLLHMENM